MIDQELITDEARELRLSEQEIMKQSNEDLRAKIHILENEVHFLKSLLRTRTSPSVREVPISSSEPMKRTHHLRKDLV